MQDFQKQFVLALLAYAVQRNIDPQRLCEVCGIDYKVLTSEKKYPLSDVQVNNLWRNAEQLSNDPLFGLHFGESMQLAALGVIGQIVQTSSTIGEALTHACSFVHLITDMFDLKVLHSEKDFKVNFIINEDKASQYPFAFRNMADYLMVFVVHELNGLLLVKVQPLAARFPYALSDPSEYSRLFACRIPSKSNELSLQFPKSILNQPVLSANYELQNHLLKQVGNLIKSQSNRHTIQTRIYNYLLSNSYLNALSLDDVAANFNLSARSLQRKLSDEGVTYFEIVEEVKKNLATTYLSSTQYSVKDISNILGYQEQSAFVRAFKRWTNKTPGEFQKKMQAAK